MAETAVILKTDKSQYLGNVRPIAKKYGSVTHIDPFTYR